MVHPYRDSGKSPKGDTDNPQPLFLPEEVCKRSLSEFVLPNRCGHTQRSTSLKGSWVGSCSLESLGDSRSLHR